MSNEPLDTETKQERREKKLQKRKEQIRQHGKSLARIYMDAVIKKLKGRGRDVDKQ